MYRHHGAALAAALSAVMLLAGCGTSGTNAGAGNSGKDIISVYGSEPAHPLFPGNTTESGGGWVVDELFAGLVTYEDGKLQENGVDPKATLSGLKAVDDKTIDVRMSQPDSAFPVKMGSHAFMPLPESAFKDPKTFGEHPVGNGPYKFESWTHNSSIVMTKNPDYHGNRVPKNDGLTFKIYTSPESAFADLKSGNLDFTSMIPASSRVSFLTDKSIKAYNMPGGGTLTIAVPENLKHFGQNEEGSLRRQAISMAVDRNLIAKKIFNDTVSPAVDFLAKPINGYSTDIKGNDALSFNAAKAKELWAKANAISPWNGDFRIAYNADGGHKAWVDAVSNSIKNTLGISAQGSPMATASEFASDVDAGKMTTAFRSGWGPDYPSPDNYLVQLFASSSADGKGANIVNYKNPAFDALMDKALSASSSDSANDYYHQGEALLMQDLPQIPLWNENGTSASTLDVSGVKFNYSGGPIMTSITKK